MAFEAADMRANALHARSRDQESDRTAQQTRDAHLRNYDPYREYDLALTLRDDDGQVCFEETYYFQPGQSVTVCDALDPGRYEVTAVLDATRRETATCRVGPAPAHTILVELGNSTVSVTQGLYG